MNAPFDLAIAGSGFAGSLMAIIARRLGLSVVLLEKGQHPRVSIGESSTPLSNLLLETLAKRYGLPWLEPLTKWGSWQQTYPQIGCGLKRGFTFFHHELGGLAADKVNARDGQLLVAASPNDALADTHWFRADFDQFLLERAQDAGAEYIDQCGVQQITREGDAWRLLCRVDDAALELRATFLVDATGPRGLLHRLFHLQEAPFPDYPATSALYSHFTGISDFSGAQHYDAGQPPYPPDAAALHHVFDGGWMWMLRFNNGWTSAGFAASHGTAKRLAFAEKEAAWERLLEQLPLAKRQFASAKAEVPFTYVPQLAFRTRQIVGDGWAMLPSAAGFVDPLLSTGFPLTLLGVLRLSEILEQNWASRELQSRLATYAEDTDGELLATADLIGALYANMGHFATFRVLSLLYFAAASYAEAVRRLGKPELAASFLLHKHPVFGPGVRKLTARARQRLSADDRLALHDDILKFIAPFDVAGLTKRPGDHCYPMRAEDLFAGAAKVGASRAEIADLLRRAGFPAEELTSPGLTAA